MTFTSKFKPKNNSGSIVASVLREKALICEVRLVHPDGQRPWFIVEVDRGKVKALHRAVTSGQQMDLRDYGTILHSGWGEPSEALKAELREKYGMYE